MMALPDILFYFFAALTLLCALLVVANPFSRSPVVSAMFLVLTVVSLAGLFVLLHAFFLAAVQILVYAGAVMVLFLFVIMLLDLKEEGRRRINAFGIIAGLLTVGSVGLVLLSAVGQSRPGSQLGQPTLEGLPAPLGKLLFTNYLLPFEILSLLLLVAMVGAIVLTKDGRKKAADNKETS